jgi:hypothetical protein
MHYFYTTIIFLFVSFSLSAQLEPDFVSRIANRYNGGNSFSALRHLSPVAGPDGSVYVVGRNGTGSSYDLVLGEDELLAEGRQRDYYFVAKFNAEGDVVWGRRFTGDGASAASDHNTPRIVASPDGGLLLLSYTRSQIMLGTDTLSNTTGQRRLMIAKISDSGTLEYTHFLPSTTNDFFAVRLARNGDLLISGRADDFRLRLGDASTTFTSNPAFFVARIAPTNGTVRWLRGIDATQEWLSVGTAYGLLETRSGDVVVSLSPAGPAFSIWGCRPSGKFGLRVARLNGDDGSVQWVKRVMEHDFGYLSDVVENPHGDLYLVGRAGGLLNAENGETIVANPNICNDRTGFLLKLYPDGEVNDLLPFPDGFLPVNIVMQSNGAYALAGDTDGVRASGVDRPGQRFQLRHYDRYDNRTQTTALPASGFTQFPSDLTMTSGTNGNSVLISGRYDMAADPHQMVYNDVTFAEFIFFVARYSLPDLPDDGPEVREEDIVLFPNPTAGFINLHTPGGRTAGWQVLLTDITGRLIDTERLRVDRSQQTFDLSTLPPGVYHLTLQDEQRRITRRVVVR